MFLDLTTESIKVISTLHTLAFFVLCPDGRRFPVSELCAEYAKTPEGIFMRSFQDRLVLVIEAVYPDGRVYWHQAFYLSTGTSVNVFKGRLDSNDARANTWMPFHGLVVKGGRLAKKQSSYKNGDVEYTDASPAIDMIHFYFLKTAHMEYYGYDPTSKPSREWNYTPVKKTAEQKKEERDRRHLVSSFGSFLPEGYYRNMHQKRSPLFDRFECLSYLLASHDLGGNAFAEAASGAALLPFAIVRGEEGNRDVDLKEEFPEFCARFALPSPPQACSQEAATSVAITKPNVINEFLTRHGAIGRMNVFRSIGETDIPVPGLNVSSVPIQNLGYEAPLEDYETLLNNYVSYYFLEYKFGKITKDDLIRTLQEPMSTIVVESNKQHSEQFQIFAPNDAGFVITLQNAEDRTYQGGRKSRRTHRHTHRKRVSRRKH